MVHSKTSKQPFSFARWHINSNGKRKYIAFNELDTEAIVVTKSGHCHVMEIISGDHDSTLARPLNLLALINTSTE